MAEKKGSKARQSRGKRKRKQGSAEQREYLWEGGKEGGRRGSEVRGCGESTKMGLGESSPHPAEVFSSVSSSSSVCLEPQRQRHGGDAPESGG